MALQDPQKQDLFHLQPALWIIILLIAMVLSACKPNPEPVVEETEVTPGIAATSTHTATPEPLKTLTICMAQEPEGLYLYDGRDNQAKWNLLEAIYDGPIDQINGELNPVILKDIPSLTNGGLRLESIVVIPGEEIIDANGQLTVFKKGVFVRPSGCTETSCALTWEGQGEFSMDVMLLNFELLEGLRWSDGVPLTAEDSLYSYELSTDALTPTSKWAVDRTASYQVLDDITLEWRGIPGFSSPEVHKFFWLPLPQHAWSNLSASELLESDLSVREPIGWGGFVIDTWKSGESIILNRNPTYFRAAEDLPVIDVLTFRFISDTNQAIEMLKAGACNLLDSSYHLEGRIEEALALQSSGKFFIQVQLDSNWEGLTIGIRPASYDDGYHPGYGDRADIFADKRTRQAFAYCIDRQRIVDEVLGGFSKVPTGLLPYDVDTDLSPYRFDVAIGAALLDEVGWKDVDDNPNTPRQAWGIPNVDTALPFEITLLTTGAGFHQKAAQIIIESLAQCGVQVTVQALPAEQLFAPGPEGVLFGRQFDLVLFSWGLVDENACGLYQTWNIPNEDNYWIGANLGGFVSEDFDRACSDSLLSLSDDSSATAKLQTVYEELMPVIPIVYTYHVMLGVPELAEFMNLSSRRSDLYRIEEFSPAGE